MSDLRSEMLEIKFHELSFCLKKLEIHKKINDEAMTLFSEYFKEYIYGMTDAKEKHKLKKIAGLATENERRGPKTGKNAKQKAQYKRGKTKVEEQEQVIIPEEKPKNPLPSEYKKLYRQIANKTHPDKAKGDKQKNKIFTEVNSAVQDEDYFKLIEYALLLGMEIPPEVPIEEEDINKKIKSVNAKIKEITKSVAWEWYHLDQEEEKTKLIEGYASFLLKEK